MRFFCCGGAQAIAPVLIEEISPSKLEPEANSDVKQKDVQNKVAVISISAGSATSPAPPPPPAAPSAPPPAAAAAPPPLAAAPSFRVAPPPTRTISCNAMDVMSALHKFRATEAPIDKFMYLRALLLDKRDIFEWILMDHTEEVLPFIYTPTVGEACQRYDELGVETHGLYLSIQKDRGHILERLQAWPNQLVDVAVVTDGERILGLGDLGVGGMGISEGKILLYTAAAAIDPRRSLPICLDVGTNNETLQAHPSYKGIKEPRVKGAEYDAFVDELMTALRTWRPHMLLQFEDFHNSNAFRLLDTYRDKQLCFNDDIQGTACVTLAALLAASRSKGKEGALRDEVLLFYGAGEAGLGIGELVAQWLVEKEGMGIEEARGHCYFMDSKGLVCASRLAELQHHKKPFAHDVPFVAGLEEAVRTLRPTALIGVSAIPAAFTEGVLAAMCEINDRPIIMPLSNPTSHSEATLEQCAQASGGRVLFASGSPFSPVDWPGKEGQQMSGSQANNAYVFPAVGAAALFVQSPCIRDADFLAAAEELSTQATDEERALGLLFPKFSRILAVSAQVSGAVARGMAARGDGAAPVGLSPADSKDKWAVAVQRSRWNTGVFCRVPSKIKAPSH